jgi:hypothetical protein
MQPDSLLPLPSATFHILMAVADEDRHGYGIIQDVSASTNGELKLSAGTLYRSIQRMLEQGLLIETRDRPAPEDDDERRRETRAQERIRGGKGISDVPRIAAFVSEIVPRRVRK